MRVLVCGGRTFDNWRIVRGTLNKLDPAPTVIIQGGAPGADSLAAKYADVHGIPLVTYPALWKQGRKAGPIRNAFMLQDSRPDIVVAFPGGRGTDNMIKLAETANVFVLKIS